MFFSKKSDGGNGGNDANTQNVAMQPPKNLPDLARDIYEKDSSLQNASKTMIAQQNNSSNVSPVQKTIVNEPDKRSVPQLDLSLVRQNLGTLNQEGNVQSGNTQSFISQTNSDIPAKSYYNSNIVSSNNAPINNTMSMNNISQGSNNFVNSGSNYVSSQNGSFNSVNSSNSINSINSSNAVNSNTSSNSMNSINSVNSLNSTLFGLPGTFNESTLLDDGFFKEFEEHILNNGYDDFVLSELLSSNLLDKMLFYHTAKSDASQFYASSTELNHAIKIKLEELKNLERAWIINNNKLQLLKKFNSTIEYDLSIRSEELKKLISENKRKFSNQSITKTEGISGDVIKNSASGSDYFQLVKKPLQPSNIRESSNNVVVNSNISSSSNFINNSSKPSNISSNSSNSSSKSSFSKYDLNKYVLSDASKFFYCRNGQIYRSLKDAIEGIKSMDDPTFNYHVNDSKNDFSKWIAGVFSDYKLSESLKSLHSRASILDYLNKTVF